MECENLNGKTIVAIGDSLFRGNKDCKGNTWLEMLAKKHNMTLYNHGINGNTVAIRPAGVNESSVPMCIRYADMEEGADYVVVLGGANDKRLNVPLGEVDSTDPHEFCGALNIMIDGLSEKYPKARMLFMTNYDRRRNPNDLGLCDIDYVLAMEKVCRNRSVPCFNNYYNSGISFSNKAHLVWMDEGVVRGEESNRHFSAEAYEWLMPRYEHALAAL